MAKTEIIQKKKDSDPVMMLGGVLLITFIIFMLAFGYGIWYILTK